MHRINPQLVKREVRVAVVGAGGTGSQVVTALAQLNHALTALGHPGGLVVDVIDDDDVSASNIGRQMFYPADLGQPKAEVLVHRVNMAMGTKWRAIVARLAAGDELPHDIVIGCVDTRVGRFNIMRAMERGTRGMSYWLDLGNRRDSGQAVLGQVSRTGRKLNPADKLPHVGELMPEVIDPKVVDPNEGPSCSLAEALERQSLFINRAVTVHGMSILGELFRHGEIAHHGVFVNLKTGLTQPLPVDPAHWARMGYGKEKRHFRRRVKKAT